jgi:hypothetical protein
MELNDITKKILNYNFEIDTSKPDNLIFIKEDIKIQFIKERLDGWELYLTYKKEGEIKLDFPLEIYTYNRNMKDIIKFFEGGLNSDCSTLTYLFILLFKEGLFILKNEKEKIIKFIEWNKVNSEFYYSEFLRMKKEF